MIKLKNIVLHKKKEVKVATHPSHDIIASDENYQNKKTVGAAWTRIAQDENGNDYKFLSGTLSKTRTHEGKEYDGYVIITEKEFDEYQKLKKEPKIKVSGYEGEIDDGSVKNIDEIDF